MSKKRYKDCRGKFVGKSLALVLAGVLLVGGVISGTVAWLTDKTDEVTNVFTTSDIDITLQEHTYDSDNDKLTNTETTTGVNNYKIVPGWTIPKDPWVTVEKGSEDCWVFIKVEEKGSAKVGGKNYGFDDFITYQIDTANWTLLEGVEGVYYAKYENRDDVDINIKILAGGTYKGYAWQPNQVLTKPEVTKEMMNALNAQGAVKPTLTFTAYASQYWKNNTESFTVKEAWENVSAN